MTDSKEKFEVGYCKPPKHTRFAKGRSGNPAGRPKRVRKKISEVMADELDRQFTVVENGRRTKVSFVEYLAKITLKRAVESGGLKEMERWFKILPLLEELRSIPTRKDRQQASLTVDDVKALKGMPIEELKSLYKQQLAKAGLDVSWPREGLGNQHD